MADDEQAEAPRRARVQRGARSRTAARPRRARDADARDVDDGVDDGAADEETEHDTGDEQPAARNRRARRNGSPRRSAADAARSAVSEVAALTGRRPESIVSVEHDDEGWTIGVEIVETRRIPDSADILAVYEVNVDEDGELTGFRRLRRYGRGQVQGDRR